MNDIEVNAIIQAICRQRNEALDAHAMVQGKLAMAEAGMAELTKRLEEFEKATTPEE